MESTERVHAQVVLTSPSGELVAKTTATATQVDGLRPSSTAVAQATAYLEKVGFRVEQRGITLSVSGPKQQFESIFSIHLSSYEQDGQTYYRPDKQATIPASAQAFVQTIVFAEPRQYFT